MKRDLASFARLALQRLSGEAGSTWRSGEDAISQRSLVMSVLQDACFRVTCQARDLRGWELALDHPSQRQEAFHAPPALLAEMHARASLLADEARDLFVSPEAMGQLHELLLGAFDRERDSSVSGRRRSGSHYTPRALADDVARETLAPLVARASSVAEILGLRLCDPAMGTGAFAFAAARFIALSFVERGFDQKESLRTALLETVRGVDADASAIRIAKRIAWIEIADPELSIATFDPLWVVGDALVGSIESDIGRAESNRSVLSTNGNASTPADSSLIARFFEERGAPLPRILDWAEAFADVFDRENPGFDAMVGNPPFIGGKRIKTMLGAAYAEWLRRVHRGANGNVDLSAHFVRRGFDLLRQNGRIGFITTNTIAQGDTRAGGLAHIIDRGGVITSAHTRVTWPGDASVVVSVVFIEKPTATSLNESNIPSNNAMNSRPAILDGRPVSSISAYLREGSVSADPMRLVGRQHQAFIGCFLRGMGFTFDDGDSAASSLSDMASLIRLHPREASAIRPYLGGEEVNTSPTHAHHRYVIDLYPLDEIEARRAYPALMRLLEKKVRPARESLGRTGGDRAHRLHWWRFANDRPELRAKLRGLSRCWVIPRVSANLSLVSLSTEAVFSEQLVVVARDDYATFAILQSRVHELWARRHSSTLGDGLRYAPSDCFETFPFPPHWETSQSLAVIGKAYDQYRSRLMKDTGLALTALWRRFHDQLDGAPDIVELRRLQNAMDQSVIDAYEWSDIRARSVFVRDLKRHPRANQSIATRLGFDDELADEVFRRLTFENAAQALAQGECLPATALRGKSRESKQGR